MDSYSGSAAAAAIGITVKRFQKLTGLLGVTGHRQGKRIWYSPEDLACVRQEHARRVEANQSLEAQLDAVEVPTAQLRRWWHEDRYTITVISGWLGLSEGGVRALLARRGIPTRRRQGIFRCGCGLLLNHEHPRCPRCGLLVCSYLDNGAGPLCRLCQEDLLALRGRHFATLRRQVHRRLVPSHGRV